MGLSGRRYPFYITITTLMVVVVVLLAGMFLWISHRESRDAGIRTADRIFAEINEKIIAKYEGKLEAVVVLTEAASSMPGMAALPEGGETGLSGLALMFNALALHEFLFSAYVGNEKGDFLQIIAVRDQPEHRDLFSAPPGTVYALRTISTDDHGTRREHWRFESHGRRLIEERVGLDPDFDPRTRPWFVRALQGEKPVFTEPYVFMSTETPGITCAQRVPDGGVFAVDFTLERLATVFKRQRVSENGVLFLFDGQGRVILHPTMDTTILGQEGAQGFLAGMEANPVIRATVEDFQAHPGTMHHRTRELLVNGVVHLIRSASIKETLNIDQIVAAAAPLSDFTGDIQRMWKRILVFSAMALLLILPVVLFMARRMSQALVRLERESQKIQRADFSESEPFDSNIKEIHSLIQAFVLMKRTIRDYTDRLIQAKREIEALFSSITTLLLTPNLPIPAAIASVFPSWPNCSPTRRTHHGPVHSLISGWTPRSSAANSRWRHGCTIAGRSPRLNLSWTRPPSWRRSATGSMKSGCASRFCCATHASTSCSDAWPGRMKRPHGRIWKPPSGKSRRILPLSPRATSVVSTWTTE